MNKHVGHELGRPANSETHSTVAHGHGSKKRRVMDGEREEERKLFGKVIKTFKTYGTHALRKVNRTMDYVDTLPPKHQSLLRDYRAHLQSLMPLIDVNQNLFRLMVDSAGDVYENQMEIYGSLNGIVLAPEEPTPADYDKLQSVMKQLCRDWSVEGEGERLSCYQPIINEIESQFKHVKCKHTIKILVPGTGTGRLAHEIVKRGYSTQGNEFSMFMLLASNFVLNKCAGSELFTCYPWINESINVLHHDHQLRPMIFPDVDPSDLLPDVQFSMVAGDFLEVYATAENVGAWQCVATSFFIDCATNIVAFVERIYEILEEGGIWINLGPLLYHYADLQDGNSIEPSYDFLMPIIQGFGFKLEKETVDVPTEFARNVHSMLSYSYKSVFFVCRKCRSDVK